MKKIDPRMKEIKDEVLNCKKCSLFQSRTWPVIGQGNHQAEIVFIAEAPGFNEDKTGRPFCGQAGKVFDELLHSAGLKREEIYIMNILKCRPPGNRNPMDNEIKACTPYLLRQLEIINPKTIGCLGNFAVSFIMKYYNLYSFIEGISKIHGKIFEAEHKNNRIRIVPLYHPAVASYNSNMADVLKADFKSLLKC